MPPITKNSAARERRAQTLLEVIVAAGMMVIALVPALALMRDALEMSQDLETRQHLTTLGVGQLDRELAAAAANWQTTPESGDYAAEGHANLHYSIIRSDDPADGGMANRLMSVRVTIWDDQNNDNSPSAGEPQTTLRSKIAKLATYEATASP